MTNWKCWMRRIILASLVTTTLVDWGLGSGRSRAEAGEGPSAERAKAVISQTMGIPADQLSAAWVAPLADTGLRQYKLVDTQGTICIW